VLEVHVDKKGTEVELISGDPLVIDLNGSDQKLG
jgi:hypothetical protein